MKVHELMSAELITITPEQDLGIALALMHEFGIRRLPVLEGDTTTLIGHIFGLDELCKGVSLGIHRQAGSRVYKARADSADFDVVVADILKHRASKAYHAMLRGDVGGIHSEGELARARGDEDDSATGLLFDVGEGETSSVHGCAEIYIQQTVPGFQVGFGCRSPIKQSRIVDQNVEPTQRFGALPDSRCEGCRVGQVNRNGKRLYTVLGAEAGCLVQFVFVTCQQSKIASLLGQHEGDSTPNAPVRACHKGNVALNAYRHNCSAPLLYQGGRCLGMLR